MTPTESLIHIALSNNNDPESLAIVKRVIAKLMEGLSPSQREMDRLLGLYQVDPVMCTLDYQELQDFIISKFGE